MKNNAAKLGIIAGGGELPAILVSALQQSGRDFFVLAIENNAEPEVMKDIPCCLVGLGEAEKGFNALKDAGVSDVVFIGRIRRPSIAELRPDKRALAFLARVGFRMLGDDNILSSVIAEFELEGFKVLGIDEVITDLLAPSGVLGKHRPDEMGLTDIKHGIKICSELGKLDVGQAVVIQEGIVLGVEAIEGTDALISRCANLKRQGEGGVLIKLMKPMQERRIDLPTIGVATVEAVHQAGLKGLAVSAGSTLLVDKEKIINKANELGIFIVGLDKKEIAEAQKKPSVFIIAGEPSGDLIGSRLMNAFAKKTKGDISFAGLGGTAMAQAGLKSIFDIKDLAVMGLFEVIPSIPKVLSRIKQTVLEIEKVKPDVVITIDSWGFTGRVNRMLLKRQSRIKRIHYVAPQVWAWKEGRAKKMKGVVDLLLTLFPNEPEYFTKHGLEATCVGHPVIESGADKGSAAEFRAKYNIADCENIICVLPGSRKNEIVRLLPVFEQAVMLLAKKYNNLKIVIPTVATVEDKVTAMVKSWQITPIIVNSEKDRYDSFAAAKAAMAASGTVALELAMAKVPHIIAYKVAPLTAVLARKFIKIKFVNLVNILLGRMAVPELLQENCTPQLIADNLINMMENQQLLETQGEAFNSALGKLGLGIDEPSMKAANIILEKIIK